MAERSGIEVVEEGYINALPLVGPANPRLRVEASDIIAAMQMAAALRPESVPVLVESSGHWLEELSLLKVRPGWARVICGFVVDPNSTEAYQFIVNSDLRAGEFVFTYPLWG